MLVSHQNLRTWLNDSTQLISSGRYDRLSGSERAWLRNQSLKLNVCFISLYPLIGSNVLEVGTSTVPG